ncbi:hypothetical protein ABZ464_27255 [Streptomyces sp. NPDC005820]|uniref:wHTH domain-containing protein n=1 Tax=Streptomyces sp. NPDC005820 TaxID=3157069 RepID=UPI0033C3EEF5
MTEPVGYWKALQRLVELAGRPRAAAVHAAMANERPRQAKVPAESTVADWTALRRVPRDDDELKLFLTALHHLARSRARHPAPAFHTEVQWRRMAEKARAERRGRSRANDSSPPQVRPGARPDWQADVTDSLVWQSVQPDNREQTEVLRQQARELVGRLGELYDDVRPALTDDPWHDEELARRTSRRINQLVHSHWRGTEGFLSPAEAALIALLPYLHHVHRSRTAADLARVDPTDLGQRETPDEERRAYEVVLRAHERLVRRAEAQVPDGRPDGRPTIGWWLFHQWAKQQPGRLHILMTDLDAEKSGLDTVAVLLEPELLSRLLSCASAGHKELFHPTRTEHLRDDPFQFGFHGRDFQTVRERLIGPLFAVAHAMAVEVTDLSSVIVRHVGIPEALDPAKLLTTVEKATWQSRRDGFGLRARCDHPAVVAALTEHTERLESLLRAVRHGGTPELGALPLYTRADEVREVDDTGAPVLVDALVRFRLDEERVQELLMGENLYRDRSLAIRELYQNALDACRYRRARSLAADEFSGYVGRIEFEQGFDDAEGRFYLQCRDNGVGMDELTLSEVFAQAGVRFTDLPRYQEERQEWQRRGVTMHPNSRFGIGVLSYFMLADEVRVTTCHMDRLEGRLRELTVLITGPGHYFRVRPTGESGTIGTTVRLYLREGDKAPSCVRELRRLLGIAEFGTTARHGSQTVKWQPGVLQPREDLTIRRDGFEAHGRTASWSTGPQGANGQVVWCEHGGGLLVDGIHTTPRVRKGILSDPNGTGRLRGAVVNLAGTTRPRRLSVDRTEILDDAGLDVEGLIRAALPTLLASQPALLTHEWLSSVAVRSPRLADIVTEAGGAEGHLLGLDGLPSDMAVAGYLQDDVAILHGRDLPGSSTFHPEERADDVNRLWRLLAHRPHVMLTALAELVPELNQVERVLPARPSDAFVWDITGPETALATAVACGGSYRSVLARMSELCLPTPALPEREPAVDDINLALLSETYGTSPGRLLWAHVEFGISVSEAVERLEAFGLVFPDVHPRTEDADEQVLRLLSATLNGTAPWLAPGKPVPPGHLIKAHLELGMDIDTAALWLRRFGLTVLETKATDTPLAQTLRLLSHDADGDRLLDPADAVPVQHVFTVAAELDRSLPDVAQELRAHGFDIASRPVLDRLTDDMLRESADWGWTRDDWVRLCGDEIVPPGLLVRAARRRGGSLTETALIIRALGLTPPATLPERADDEDEIIFRGSLGEPARWLTAGSHVSAYHLARASLATGLSPATVASRLRAYGVLTPDAPFPPAAVPDDEQLLLPKHMLSNNRRIAALSRAIRLADQLSLPRHSMVQRMGQYGIAVQGSASAEALGALNSELLNRCHRREGSRRVLVEPLPLHHLVGAATHLGMAWDEAVRQMSSLDLRIRGDVTAELDGFDRRLCTRGSRPTGNDRLHLDEPIPDYLSIVKSSKLPAPDLVARLERLGVDLDRVRAAVRTALPKVPGLVMRSEAEEAHPPE